MVTSKLALKYHMNPDGIPQFFQKFGKNFESNVLDPGLQVILKAVTARYTAEEVITKREQLREDTHALVNFCRETHKLLNLKQLTECT